MNFQNELSHFENRIRKAQYVKERIDKIESKLEQGHDVDMVEHEELKQTAKLYNRKVRK